MSTDNISPEDTIPSNVVTITDDAGVISHIDFVPNSIRVSKGQESGQAATITPENNSFKISLDAGRHKTSDIADKFNQLSGGQGHEYAPSFGSGGTPDELNFFFQITIWFLPEDAPVPVTLCIGQGNFGGLGGTNNWWIGGSDISTSTQPQLSYIVDSSIIFLSLSGSHDSFTLNIASTRPISPIKHVFVLMLENHSFDNMLAMSFLPGIDAATTDNSNFYDQRKYRVVFGAPAAIQYPPGHEFPDVLEQLCGEGATYQSGGTYPAINNSGYAANYATTTTESGPRPFGSQVGDIMGCFDTQRQLPIMYQLAKQFVICDQWFSSMPGRTWPNRLFVHAASSGGLDHTPSALDLFEFEKLFGFTFPNGSIFDTLNSHQIPFALYQDKTGPSLGQIPQVAGIHNISSSQVHSLEDFVSDIKGNYPYAYTFIEPSYGDILDSTFEGGSSQHPVDGVARGEQLIQTVYEAIRGSSIWNNSLLIITYDEHGGFYDHVSPPGAANGVTAPNDGSSSRYNTSGFTFQQLGPRVPTIVISPLVHAQVDHIVYDHTSVLATIELLFGLVKSLTARDGHANNVLHLLVSEARTDCPRTLGRPAPEPVRPPMTAARRMLVDQEPLPDQGNVFGFLMIAAKSEYELSARTPADRAAIFAKLTAIKTKGEARAYLESVVAKVEAAKAKGRRP